MNRNRGLAACLLACVASCNDGLAPPSTGAIAIGVEFADGTSAVSSRLSAGGDLGDGGPETPRLSVASFSGVTATASGGPTPKATALTLAGGFWTGTLSGLLPGSYCVTIEAQGLNNEIDYDGTQCNIDVLAGETKTASVQISPKAPAAPSNLVATPVSSSRINLSWQDDSGIEDGYRIERCEGMACSDFAFVATLASNDETYNDVNLLPATSYGYQVCAQNGGVHACARAPSATTFMGIIGGTVNREGPFLGTSFLFDPLIPGDGSISFVDVSGPGNWKDGAIHRVPLNQPLGTSATRSFLWVFIPPVSGEYAAAPPSGLPVDTGAFVIDAASTLPLPVIDSLVDASTTFGRVIFNWTASPSSRSFVVQVDSLANGTAYPLLQFVMPGGTTGTTVNMPLFASVQYRLEVIAFSHDVGNAPDPLTGQFNIAIGTMDFTAAAGAASGQSSAGAPGTLPPVSPR